MLKVYNFKKAEAMDTIYGENICSPPKIVFKRFETAHKLSSISYDKKMRKYRKLIAGADYVEIPNIGYELIEYNDTNMLFNLVQKGFGIIIDQLCYDNWDRLCSVRPHFVLGMSNREASIEVCTKILAAYISFVIENTEDLITFTWDENESNTHEFLESAIVQLMEIYGEVISIQGQWEFIKLNSACNTSTHTYRQIDNSIWPIYKEINYRMNVIRGEALSVCKKIATYTKNQKYIEIIGGIKFCRRVFQSFAGDTDQAFKRLLDRR
jgi:hypothetical protein